MSIRTYLTTGFLSTVASVAYTTDTYKVGTVLGDAANSLKAFFDGSDIRTRKEAEFSSVAAKPSSSAPNGYTQNRASVYLKYPLTLDNGLVTTNTIQITLSKDVETTSTEVDEMLLGALDVINSGRVGSELKEFFHHGSID